jgi:ribosome biogenesis protein NSA2
VTHPELQATFQLEILGVKKNPQGAVTTQLGVITKGTVIEVRPLTSVFLGPAIW